MIFPTPNWLASTADPCHTKDMKTETITASELVERQDEFDALVADNAEKSILYITGEVYVSWAMPGHIGVETPFGALYVDEDEELTVRRA